jgi:hypothetical protein
VESSACKEKVYRPRHPEKTAFYSVLFHYFDRFAGEYEERFEKEYGRWRNVISQTVGKYLDCGNLKRGFARIRCPQCREEYLLGFSCKVRLCPSCSAKRSVLWADFVSSKVLQPVKHAHVVFSIPKILRIFFKFNRKLLGELCRCAWKAFGSYMGECMGKGVQPGGIFSIQTAGDSLNWNPHIHAVVCLGGYGPDGSFQGLERFDTGALRRLFEAYLMKMLVGKGLITRELVEKILSWSHTGFHVYCGTPLETVEEVVKVGYYMIRPPASASRLKSGGGVLRYEARAVGDVGGYDASLFEPRGETFDYLEWIARLTSHIPDKGAQTVHYYGAYSNKHRGVVRKRVAAGTGQAAAGDGKGQESEGADFERPTRKQWAALVKQIFEADPLICPRCKGKMKIVAVIEKASVIDRILKHLGYRFDIADLAAPATGPPPPFYWSAEDFSSSRQS